MCHALDRVLGLSGKQNIVEDFKKPTLMGERTVYLET